MTAPPQASEGSRAVKRTIEFIRHHRLQKGDRLPSERELSDRFGVTRSSVREALAVLDALRLTERRPKSGIFLRNALEDSGLNCWSSRPIWICRLTSAPCAMSARPG